MTLLASRPLAMTTMLFCLVGVSGGEYEGGPFVVDFVSQFAFIICRHACSRSFLTVTRELPPTTSKNISIACTRLRACITRLSCVLCDFSETKVPLSATANKLVFKENGIDHRSSYQLAVDGQLSQEWIDCSVSKTSTPTVWLSIDLGRLYSVNKIRLLSRLQFGSGSRIYVGKKASTSNGTNDHQCGSSVVFPNPAPSTFIDFLCSPVDWVQYLSIRRSGYTDIPRTNGQYLQVCEVEVYYDETEGRNTWHVAYLADYILFL